MIRVATRSQSDPQSDPKQENPSWNPLLLNLVPLAFVLIWSTGFIVAKFGLPYAPPLTFLILRFIGVLLFLLPLVWVLRAPWPRGKQAVHIAVSGMLLHAAYLGGVWTAIKLGMPAGLSALIVGLQPVLTAFAAPFVGERVKGRQWLGLGLGLCGVGLVVANKISLIGLSWMAIWLCVMALVSITIGTLYQKRFCAHFDLRTGTIIQFIASGLVLLPFAIFVEDFSLDLHTVTWTWHFIGALLWSILALSIGAIFLLFALIRRSAATQVTSLLYLTPPTTAVMAWLMFGEAFSMVGIAGMVIAVIGVAFVVRK
ncbi:DMT(drug/metabolite transporter) superfamily permease [Herbaspirillum sp. CF444]|uniref:DMT family transporter n=1 Tax=Herbaspirillum sp. CF444 TaxID=1144319 RepID=UPI000272738B|nr:DMT family transporter [Herbaspirillum sp. CF444]EJL91661.1 DMT(drug/metabolite transporter) superfamily permease [Herbaspirillum sp. CF444]